MLWAEKFTDSGTKDCVWLLRKSFKLNRCNRELRELREDKLEQRKCEEKGFGWVVLVFRWCFGGFFSELLGLGWAVMKDFFCALRWVVMAVVCRLSSVSHVVCVMCLYVESLNALSWRQNPCESNHVGMLSCIVLD